MSNKIFEKISGRKPRYSAFDLSREQKLSCRFGQLIPTFFEEIVPGDEYKVKTETMVRLAPMLAPVMHRVNVYMHYFFVPNRIVWNQWEDFITGGKDGLSSPSIPTWALDDAYTEEQKKLLDYFGIPPQAFESAGNTGEISQLPFRAYQKIWNDYFRDPNLEDEFNVESGDRATLNIKYRCWEKDYFTSALPFAQRGPAVGVPVDIKYTHAATAWWAGTDIKTGPGKTFRTFGSPEGPNSAIAVSLGVEPQEWEPIRIENIETDQLNFSINELRTSSALQRWLEKQARGGYRYIETIKNQFGVKSSDQRLQRPQYLGGGRQPVVISEVLNTTGTAEAPQGDMAGHGISTGTTNSFSQKFEEHGYVIGILSILPKTGYSQGINKTFLRKDKYDYFWPEFADLGEQEVKNIELYVEPGEREVNDETFGYQQRYAEYKYGQNTVHGAFRTSLEFWHMARKFDTPPALNGTFVRYPKAGPDQRTFAVQDVDNLWIQMYHNVKARRPMPYFSNPQLR